MSYKDMQYIYNKNYKGVNANKNHSSNVNMLEETARSGVGYILLNVMTGMENAPLSQAYIVVYVRHETGIQIPIMSVMSTLSPILIQLSVAYSPETLVDPENDPHSIYELIIVAEGYYTTRLLNIRMFDDEQLNFNINMIPAVTVQPMRGIERVIELPLFPVL